MYVIEGPNGPFHEGSCKGRGLWMARDYHGYRRLDDKGEVVEIKKCPCCLLECAICIDEPCLHLLFVHF